MWQSLAKKYPEVYANGMWLSWDNATWHKAGGALGNMRGLKVHWLPLPSQSHDMHKVIEHAINTLKAAARKYFNDHPEIRKADDVKAAFEKLFYKVVTAAAVRKDIKSLKSTYRVINRSVEKGGTAGDWPPKRYR